MSVIRQLTESETDKAIRTLILQRNPWCEYGKKLAQCKVGEGIEVEVPEGMQVGGCANGVRSSARTLGMTISAHIDRRTRKVVFKRIG